MYFANMSKLKKKSDWKKESFFTAWTVNCVNFYLLGKFEVEAIQISFLLTKGNIQYFDGAI